MRDRFRRIAGPATLVRIGDLIECLGRVVDGEAPLRSYYLWCGVALDS